MAEEWGSVVFRIVDEFQGAFDESEEVPNLAALLTAAGGISADKTKDLSLTTKKMRVRSGYVMIEYYCGDWRAFSEMFVAQGDGLEFYSRTLDEYGASGYFALSGDGERFSFSFDLDGDMFEVEGYEEEVEGKIGEWMSLLPEDLKEQFPGFVGEDDDEPFPDWPDDTELLANSTGEGSPLLGCWQWRNRESVLLFTNDNRVITFELYNEPDVMSLEWLTENRIQIDGIEASFEIAKDELTMTFGDGREEKCDRVDSPRILTSLDSSE